MCIYTGGCISDTCVENGVTKKKYEHVTVCGGQASSTYSCGC